MDKYPTLAVMNKWLEKFGQPTQASRYAAVKSLSKIHINIYDLRSGRLNRTFSTIDELAKYSMNHRKLFPKHSIRHEFKLFQKTFYKYN